MEEEAKLSPINQAVIDDVLKNVRGSGTKRLVKMTDKNDKIKHAYQDNVYFNKLNTHLYNTAQLCL